MSTHGQSITVIHTLDGVEYESTYSIEEIPDRDGKPIYVVSARHSSKDFGDHGKFNILNTYDYQTAQAARAAAAESKTWGVL